MILIYGPKESQNQKRLSKMKRFILYRTMQYTERGEIEAEDWDAAVEVLNSEAELDHQNDDVCLRSTAEYIGEVEEESLPC
jgi:uncharacterized protein (DUF608 family)